MESKILGVRLSTATRREAERRAKADGIKASEWVRRLVERETGVAGDLKVGGLANMSKKRRKQVSAAGVKARVAAQHEEKSP